MEARLARLSSHIPNTDAFIGPIMPVSLQLLLQPTLTKSNLIINNRMNDAIGDAHIVTSGSENSLTDNIRLALSISTIMHKQLYICYHFDCP